MDQTTQARSDAAAERPIHRACLVSGCPCKADRIVPSNRTALVAAAAFVIGEADGRDRSPDPAWRFVGLPIA
jgi:hypothetical protein